MKKLVSYFIILTFFIFYSSCTKNGDTPTEPGDGGGNNSGNIQVGETIEVITGQSIGTNGGKITVNKPGDKLDGLEITIPSNAFTQTKTFKVSYSEIKNHQLGQYFNPISPMISISYEGGYTNKPIEVKVPIKLPKDNFAMGFFYDEKTGKLEGLPIESLDSNYITVSTRTFSQSSSLGKSRGINDANSVGEMIISSISESTLKSQAVIASGFQPGVDDWEFINYGSYIAPRGHCAGQSMTMMWYYYEKKLKGEQSLFHRFDEVNEKTNPGKLWQDNPLGYRFASTIQEDFNFDGWVTSLEWKQNFPGLTFKAFAASILITGEPQFVLIRNSSGQGGHAMVVYKVNFNEGKLYIADPNYPNNRVAGDGSESIRTINLENGVLKPYETGLTAGAHSTTMDQIGYFGKTAYIDWGQMAKRWVEVENKTIGNDRFPAYDLMVNQSVPVPLQDGMTIDKDTLSVFCKSTQCSQFLSGTDHLQVLWIYDNEGKRIAVSGSTSKGIAYVKIKPGLNKLGIYIMGAKNDIAENYIDFKWFNIYYSSLMIDPDPIIGQPNENITITAMSYATAPKDAKYIWNFGDQTNEVTKNNDSVVTHQFAKEGEYEVRVSLYDNLNNKLVGTAVADAKILSGLIAELQKCKWIEIDFRADVKCNNDIVCFSGLSVDNEPPYQSTTTFPVQWSGTSFNVNFSYVYNTFGNDTSYHNGYLRGEVSADGLNIKSLSAKDVRTVPKGDDIQTEEISVINIPYDPNYEYGGMTPRFSIEGAQTAGHVNSYTISWWFLDSEGKETTISSQSTNWNNPEDVPYVYITFFGKEY